MIELKCPTTSNSKASSWWAVLVLICVTEKCHVPMHSPSKANVDQCTLKNEIYLHHNGSIRCHSTVMSCYFCLNSFLALNLVKTYRQHDISQRLMPQSAGAIAAFMDVTLSHFPHASPYSKSWKEWHLSGAHQATISVYHVINLQKKGNTDSVSEVLPWKHPLNMRSAGAAIIHCSKMKGRKNLLPSLHDMKPGGCWLQSKGYSYKHVYIYIHTFVYCNIH